ncbi:catalase family peroxidase [Ningiella sp. W23]|uniref:catalase family peroxidase n=1 Tax=Ningiella sp. W23 TaxID=3023715 RepID=UPI0037567A01
MNIAPKATLSALALSCLITANVSAQQAPASVSANDFIELFEKLGGKHAGFRKAHAAGVCANGEFTPNEDASKYSSSLMFQQSSVPAQVRFSVGGPNPLSDERETGVRGIGISLTLEDGSRHNITGNNTPFFTGKDPETFFGFLQNLVPDESGRPDMAALGAYIAANPSVQNAVAWSQSNPTPASYAAERYFGIHTFYMENTNGQLTKFKWTLSPDAGEQNLSEQDKESLGPKYLEERLVQDIEQGKATFTLTATLGQEGDADTDPSVAWPEDRETIQLGTLTLISAGGEACNPTNFDPNVLSAGFKGSDDPVLKMRTPAYGISFGKRLSNQ